VSKNIFCVSDLLLCDIHNIIVSTSVWTIMNKWIKNNPDKWMMHVKDQVKNTNVRDHVNEETIENEHI
jgi:hypothetical protein